MAGNPKVPKIPFQTTSKRRWLRWFVVAPLLLVLLALGGAILFRQEAGGWLARSYLENQGVDVQSLTISAFSFDHLELSNLSIGAAEELTARVIKLSFLPSEFSILPQQVEIEGLRLRLDLSGEGPLLGSLQRPLDALQVDGADDDPVGSDPAQLPAVTVREAEIIGETGAGPMSVALQGQVRPNPDGRIFALVNAQADGPVGRFSADVEGGWAPDQALTLKARIAEGMIDWRWLAVQQFGGALTVALSPGAAPRIEGDFALSGLAYRPKSGPALRFAEGKLTASGDRADFALRGELTGEDDRVALNLKGRQVPTVSGRQMGVVLDASLQAKGPLAEYLSLPAVGLDEGNATLLAEMNLGLPEGTGALPSWQEVPALARTVTAEVSGDVILAKVVLSGGSRGISAHLPFAARLQEDHLDLRLREDGQVRVEQPAKQRLLDLGVPSDLLPLFRSGLSLSVAARGERPFSLRSHPAWPLKTAELASLLRFTSEQGLSAGLDFQGSAEMDPETNLETLDGRLKAELRAERLSLGDREARGLAASFPLNVRLDQEGLQLSLVAPGRANLQQLGGALPLRLNKPVDLTIEQATVSQRAGDRSYRYELKGRTTSIEAELQPATGEALGLQLAPTELALAGRFDPVGGHDGSVQAMAARLAIPAYDLTAKDLGITTDLDRDLRPMKARFSAGPIAQGEGADWIEPLAIEGAAARRGGGYDISAQVALVNGGRLADIAARYNDSGTAKATLRSDELRFATDGLQPRDISPLLAGLEEVSGQVSGEAVVVWPRDPSAESGQIEIRDLSFSSQGVGVEGLSLELVLQSLLPLSSPPDQRLTVRRIDAGAPVDDIELRFSLTHRPRPQLAIADGRFGLGGALWSIKPTRLDPTATQNKVVLATDNLDLATFFELIEIDGLSGSGILVGQIPIIFDGKSIVVADGELTAQAPGRLSLRSQALTSALAGGGETVELAIQALQDFRYETLTVGLDKTAENEAQVRLSILGHNPTVLDGQPFQFNINLESNLTSVLEALKQGYSLSDEALRRAWRLRE